MSATNLHTIDTVFVGRTPLAGVDLIDPGTPFEAAQMRSRVAAQHLGNSIARAMRRFERRARRRNVKVK